MSVFRGPSVRAGAAAAVALLGLALAVRLAFVAATPDYVPRHDDAQYDRLACAILVADAYTFASTSSDRTSCGTAPADARPTAFRPPAYPAFLAGVYAVVAPLPIERWDAARVVQAILGTGLVALLGLVARELWGPRAGLAALALGALCLPLAVLTASLLVETLLVTLLFGAVAAVLAAGRSRHAAAWSASAGVLVGLAVLTRPNAAVVLLPLGVALARPTRWDTVARAGLLVGAAVLTVAPWTIRNAVQMESFAPVSTHVGEAIAGTYNSEARSREDHPGAWRVPGRVDELGDLYADHMPEVDRQRELLRRGLRYAAENPTYVGEVGLRNTQRLLNLEGAAWWRGNTRAMSLPERAGDVAAVAFFPFALLALAAALSRKSHRLPGWLWATAALLFLSIVFVAGEMRFRAPLDAFLVLLGAAGLAGLPRRTAGRRKRRHGRATTETTTP